MGLLRIPSLLPRRSSEKALTTSVVRFSSLGSQLPQTPIRSALEIYEPTARE